jgi:ribosomal protein S18 acetylase RimI-like enzyme
LLAADARSLAPLICELDPWRTLGVSAELMGRTLTRQDPILRRFVVLHGEQTAGVICLRHPWLRGAYLELFCIFPAFQKRKLGREVMQWFAQRTYAVADNVWATVSSFNEPARAFYRAIGFQELCVLTDLVKPGFDEILLRRARGGP